MKETGEKAERNSKCEKVGKWIGTSSFYLIINFLLSQWGDWMWLFSVGVYLSELSDKHLRLAATFGLVGGGCVLLFGGLIGDWVDRNGRLKVVRVSLFLQNSAVAVSAIGVCVAIKLKESNASVDPYIKYSLEAFVVLMAVVAQLASVAYKIAIEKDWVVVIAQGKSSFLTNLNATTRSLDLACKIVSPMTAGYIMSAASTFTSAVVLAAWNIVSMFVEYGLLSLIYRKVPALASKKGRKEKEEEIEMITEAAALKEKEMLNGTDEKGSEIETKSGKNERADKPGLMMRTLRVMGGGWKTYARQEVLWAGVSLALLYMTVLGFDAITVAYIIANDITPFLVGIAMGLAGFTGIVGALIFSKMAKRLGLNKTGVFSFSAEVLCLTLVVASVWAPGSRFDPYLDSKHQNNIPQLPTTFLPKNSSDLFANHTTQSTYVTQKNSTELIKPHDPSLFRMNTSIILLLVGIILSRVGLWMSDLVVTQLLQENIAEEERGVVNGVQNSLNMLMEMLKFCLVVLVPDIHLFGIHIILSFTFVSSAMLCFFWYASKSRGKKGVFSQKTAPNVNEDELKQSLHNQEISLSIKENPIS